LDCCSHSVGKLFRRQRTIGAVVSAKIKSHDLYAELGLAAEVTFRFSSPDRMPQIGKRWNLARDADRLTVMADNSHDFSAIERGDRLAAEQLLPQVYDELRKLAAWRLSQESPGQTLQATALVHEAYVRLVDREEIQEWDSRRHFFAAAGEAMRRILVERARRKHGLRGGGRFRRQDLQEDQILTAAPPEEILALDEALQRLADKDPRKARLVELRYFIGLTTAEAAEVLGVSVATAERDWSYARAWLHRQIAATEQDSSES
jgi:RNA polymerase sigma factor (TIGR02999 family)